MTEGTGCPLMPVAAITGEGVLTEIHLRIGAG
jgi:hypothetical protein